MKRINLIVIAILLTSAAGISHAQTSAFTYQGRFTDGGTPANGTYDMQFKLFDGGGNQIGSTITNGAVTVTNGVFTVQLDYGAPTFSGADRFLEIGVRSAGSLDPYTVLTPRQQLTSAVYAIRAGNATSADTATNTLQLGGVAANQYVQTNDSRLTDSRPPTAGSSSYIQNTANQQAASNFNISGSGTAGGTLAANTVNAVTQFNLGGSRVLSNPGDNTFAGIGAGSANSVGARNAFFGTLAGSLNTAGSNNSFFGWNSGSQNQGFQNSFFGASAGASNKTANGNSFFGYGAGSLNTTGDSNSFFGANAGLVNTSSSNNSFFGKDSGANNVGVQNSFFGSKSGTSNAAGNYNAFFGYGAGTSNQSGDYNSFFGSGAGASNTTADSNSFFGSSAGGSNTTGSVNAFFGLWSGLGNTTGSGNVYLGVSAGGTLNGSYNTYVGYGAVQSGAARTYTTAIGEGTDVKSGLVNASAIGAKALVEQNNSLVLGSIDGLNGASADTNVGIGTTTPSARFHVAVNGGNFLVGNAGCNSGFVGVGFGSSLSECANYSLLGNGTDTIINRPTGGVVSFRENNTTQMSIASGGVVTINTLGVAGSISLCRNPLNQISTCSSSLRYKTNIQPFVGGLSVLNRLRPITFDWKQGGLHDLGFGAEDVATIEPLLVTRNDKGEVEGVKYDRITAVLVNAVKEQQEQIKRQQIEIETLKTLVCRRNRRAPVCK